jgi:hypothetical protein
MEELEKGKKNNSRVTGFFFTRGGVSRVRGKLARSKFRLIQSRKVMVFCAYA